MFRLALMYSCISITVIYSSRSWLPSGAAHSAVRAMVPPIFPCSTVRGHRTTPCVFSSARRLNRLMAISEHGASGDGSSWSDLHETALSRMPWLAAKSLKSKRRPCGRLPSIWSCSVVVGMLVFRGAVVRGPASVVRLFCRVCCCVFCERPCTGFSARCPRCTRVNGTHPLGHGHCGRAVWAS